MPQSAVFHNLLMKCASSFPNGFSLMISFSTTMEKEEFFCLKKTRRTHLLFFLAEELD